MKKIRIAIIGCGAVAALHASGLAEVPDAEFVSVYSPDHDEAVRFADVQGFQRASSTYSDAVKTADVVLIASPSAHHFEQAQISIASGKHTLIELPASRNAAETEELGRLALQNGVFLASAHTARFLEPYRLITSAMTSGLADQILQINAVRYLQLKARRWFDNVLQHHIAHVLDLALGWCGSIAPEGCIAHPGVSGAQSAVILGKLPNGASLSIAMSYEANRSFSQMLLATTAGLIETDGFSYLRSNLPSLQFAGDAEVEYAGAIARQDRAFLSAIRSGSSFVPWSHTVALARCVEAFVALGGLRASDESPGGV